MMVKTTTFYFFLTAFQSSGSVVDLMEITPYQSVFAIKCRVQDDIQDGHRMRSGFKES